LWIHGPWSLQGEDLRSRVSRRNGLPSYVADGYYAFASYVLTGESRGYAAGNTANVKPRSSWGALELLARYSALDLDHGNVNGGRQHDVTVGANWYLTPYFKFQGNYVWARASRQGVRQSPDIVEVRAQVAF
jgi:phosphate-selective porin OprO/OprP